MRKHVIFYLRHRDRIRLLPIRLVNRLYCNYVIAAVHLRRIIKFGIALVVPASRHDSVMGFINSVRHKYFNMVPQCRWYIADKRSISEFFQLANKAEIEYVILRWFEELPHIEPGEDIDILVSDKDLDKIRSLCDPYENGGQKLDIYSASGKSGSDYLGAGYFPFKLSERLLESRKLINNYFYVLDDREYFVALAFHAVFHKGKASGLPYKRNDAISHQSDHDYTKHLKAMASAQGININDFSFCGLYEYLVAEGYTPGIDTVRLYARHDPWLQELTIPATLPKISSKGEVVVFILRKWAYDNDKIEYIKDIVESRGFDILYYSELSQCEVISSKGKIRGGQWGKGSYPVSGGPPYGIMVCFDYAPEGPDKNTKEIFPHLSNRNILIKHEIRDAINRDLLYTKHVNCIHSADDEHEAWEYINAAVPDRANEFRDSVAIIRSSNYFHSFHVYRPIVTNGVRAKTELIDYKGARCILKTFKPGRERFLEREAFAYGELSRKIDAIPKLIEKGDCYIIVEYIENILEGLTERERIRIIKKYTFDIVSTMRQFYENGYAILGFYPGNLLISLDKGLKVVDFEFLHKYEINPDTFEESYDVAGVPSDFTGDMPRGDSNHTIENTWKYYLDMKVVKELLV